MIKWVTYSYGGGLITMATTRYHRVWIKRVDDGWLVELTHIARIGRVLASYVAHSLVDAKKHAEVLLLLES